MKSEVMWLGSKQNCTDIYLRVVWKRRLKSVGVLYFTCDRCAFQVEEGTRRTENMNSIINVQEKGNVSIAGHVCVVTTCLMSQFVYIMQALAVLCSVLTQLNRLLFRFLWRKKDNRKAFEKVKRTLVFVCCDLENVGLNMSDLKQISGPAPKIRMLCFFVVFCCNKKPICFTLFVWILKHGNSMFAAMQLLLSFLNHTGSPQHEFTDRTTTVLLLSY